VQALELLVRVDPTACTVVRAASPGSDAGSSSASSGDSDSDSDDRSVSVRVF
jgi:hypothetical protein